MITSLQISTQPQIRKRWPHPAFACSEQPKTQAAITPNLPQFAVRPAENHAIKNGGLCGEGA
jgi:hypothetical protein